MDFLKLIQGTADCKPLLVPTPEWPQADGKIFVRRLTAAERVQFHTEAAKQKATRGADFQAFIVAYCACNADGKRGFEDHEWQALLEEPGTAIERLSDAADELNVLSAAAQEEIKKKYAKTTSCESNLSSAEKTESV
jgi:hypothetical protein